MLGRDSRGVGGRDRGGRGMRHGSHVVSGMAGDFGGAVVRIWRVVVVAVVAGGAGTVGWIEEGADRGHCR